MKPLWLLFALFLVIGVACLALGLNDYIHQEAWFAHAAQADGTVTAYDLHVRNDGKSEFCPRIEFTTQAGEPATTYGDICPSQPDQSQVGQHVTVYYDPNNPSDTRSKGWLGVEGSGLIVSLAGCVFFPFIGSLSVVLPIWQNRRAAAKVAKGRLPAAEGATTILQQDPQRYHADRQAAELRRLQKENAELKRKMEEERRQKGH
jgi:hypothetical protein